MSWSGLFSTRMFRHSSYVLGIEKKIMRMKKIYLSKNIGIFAIYNKGLNQSRNSESIEPRLRCYGIITWSTSRESWGPQLFMVSSEQGSCFCDSSDQSFEISKVGPIRREVPVGCTYWPLNIICLDTWIGSINKPANESINWILAYSYWTIWYLEDKLWPSSRSACEQCIYLRSWVPNLYPRHPKYSIILVPLLPCINRNELYREGNT